MEILLHQGSVDISVKSQTVNTLGLRAMGSVTATQLCYSTKAGMDDSEMNGYGCVLTLLLNSEI